MLIGLPVLAPQIRHEFGLSLVQVGFVIDSVWIGGLLTLLPWGLLADRVGERLVLAAGLGGCAAALVGASHAGRFGVLLALLGIAGAAGASVNAASGRAVMYWFPAAERGLALGVRQTAIPLGGFIAALALPALGLENGLLLLAAMAAAGALFGASVIHDPEGAEDVLQPRRIGETLRDGRLWLLCSGSSFYLVAQLASPGSSCSSSTTNAASRDGEAALVLAGIQVLAAAFRIGGGRWSDRVGSRVGPLRLVGRREQRHTCARRRASGRPRVVLVAALVLAGGLAMAWNGLSFTAAAEIAGRARSGAALGMQQTALAATGAVLPPAFAAVVASTLVARRVRDRRGFPARGGLPAPAAQRLSVSAAPAASSKSPSHAWPRRAETLSTPKSPKRSITAPIASCPAIMIATVAATPIREPANVIVRTIRSPIAAPLQSQTGCRAASTIPPAPCRTIRSKAKARPAVSIAAQASAAKTPTRSPRRAITAT